MLLYSGPETKDIPPTKPTSHPRHEKKMYCDFDKI